MAKSSKKTIDENGNIVDVVTNSEINSDILEPKISFEQKKKSEPKEYIFQLVDKVHHTTSSIPRPPYPEVYFIRNSDVIFDEESGTERNIRYLEGVSTIFEDEQEHLSDAKKKQRPEIKFIYGVLRVDASRTSLIKFLMSSNMCEAKKNRMRDSRVVYRLLDFEKQEEESISAAELRMKAMKLAMDAPVEIMIPHAQYFGINFKNQYNEDRGEKAIRVDYLSQAESKPEAFINSYNNPIVKVEYIIRKALNVGMIDTHTTKGQAIWGDSKKFITVIPDRAEPVKHLSEYALSDKGADFYLQLKSMAD